MVSRILAFLNRDLTNMNQAALVLAVFSITSQLFGLVRDRLLASFVGPGPTLDVYYASFRIPDLVYNSVGALFSVAVLIPFITSLMKGSDDARSESVQRFSRSIVTIYVVGMLVVCIVVALCMPALARLVAPGFHGAQQELLVRFSRLMLISPFVMGLASLLGAFAQVRQKFLSFAIAPVFYNAGILVGILGFYTTLGIMGVVLGVILGAIFYFLVQVPTLLSLHGFPKLTRFVDWGLVVRIWKLSLPRALGLSLGNLTFVLLGSAASLLVAGSLSIFQFAYNIETTPLLIVGVSYAVAAFPALTRLASEGNTKEFLSLMYRATRNIFFLAVPLSLFIIVLRAHTVRILLGAGVFSWNDTRLVAAALALFSISVVAQCMIFLLVRGFYALGNTRTPLILQAVTLCITAIVTVGLVALYQMNETFATVVNALLRTEGTVGGGVLMLALAYSIGQIVCAILLWVRLHTALNFKDPQEKTFVRSLWHMVGAGIIGAGCAYGALVVTGMHLSGAYVWQVFGQAAFAATIGAVGYGIVLFALGNDDIHLFVQMVKSKFWSAKPIVPEPQDL